MTYVLAWKYKKTAFVISDTAITSNGLPIEKFSSFGERQIDNSNRSVEEVGVKIIKITELLTVAYSGSVETARSILVELKIKLFYESLEDALNNISKDNPSLQKYYTELVFLQNNKNRPIISSWNNKQKILSESNESLYSMGSLDDHIRIQIESYLNFFLQSNIDEEHLLHTILSYMQYLGIHNPLMTTSNVGGAIFGGLMNSNGFIYNSDITYILFPPNLSKIAISKPIENISIADLSKTKTLDIITCIVRDNVFITSSSITNHPKTLMSTENMTLTVEEWVNKWSTNIKSYFDEIKSKYFAFVSKIPGRIILIKNPKLIPSNKYFTIKKLDGTVYNITMTGHFVDELLRMPSKQEINTIGVRFDFKNG